MRRFGIAALMSLSLAGCVGGPISQSYVGGLAGGDGVGVADAMMGFITARLHPADGSIYISAPGDDVVVSSLLAKTLARSGYRVALNDAGAQHQLRYDVQPFDEDILMHATLDDVDATQILQHDATGRLVPAGPLLAREFTP